MPNNSLYQPLALHDLKRANRIALAPMTRSRAGTGRHLIEGLKNPTVVRDK